MISILFVCFANACRSQALQAVMEKKLQNQHLEESFYVDSCGISPAAIGETINLDMAKALAEKGYISTHRSRLFQLADFDQFDYIMPVTSDIKHSICSMAPSKEDLDKVILATNFLNKQSGQDMADPYLDVYGGFIQTVNESEEICENIIKNFLKSR